MKSISLQVVQEGGIVQAVHNHGVRQLPHRFQAKYPDYLTQQRYYDQGRFVSLYYEANPTTQQKVIAYLDRQSDQVLRHTHLHAQSKLDWLNLPDNVAPSTYRHNPYVKRAFFKQQMEEAAEEKVSRDDVTGMEGEFLDPPTK